MVRASYKYSAFQGLHLKFYSGEMRSIGQSKNKLSGGQRREPLLCVLHLLIIPGQLLKNIKNVQLMTLQLPLLTSAW